VATDAVSSSVRAGTSLEAIMFVCFDQENLELYQALPMNKTRLIYNRRHQEETDA
jgi:hypothetical protein